VSIWHWVIVLVVAFIYVAPCWMIVKKAGFAGVWSLLVFVPLLNLVMLWIFAMVEWPSRRGL